MKDNWFISIVFASMLIVPVLYTYSSKGSSPSLPQAGIVSPQGICLNCPGGGGGGGGSGGGGGDNPPSPKLAVYTISWNDFSQCLQGSNDQVQCYDNTLPDNDDIWFTEVSGNQANVAPSDIEITLTSASTVTFWKEIKAFNKQGQEIDWIHTQDAAHGPVKIRLNNGLGGLIDSLVFSKGKQFNIHTGMYQVFNVSNKLGKRLSFTWRRD